MIDRISRLVTKHSHVNWALADQGVISGVNFLTGILLARHLGLEEFGRFTLAWMAIIFVNLFQHAAVIAPMMSIGPKQSKDGEADYYGAVVVHQLVIGLVVFALVWIGALVTASIAPSWRIDGLALPLACTAIAFQFQDFLRRYFFTLGRGRAAFLADAVRYLGQLVILLWLFGTTQLDSAGALWVIAALAALSALLSLPAVRLPVLRIAAFASVTRRHWHFSRWLMATALVQWTSGQLFFVIAGAMLGAAAVGAMRAAQNLMGLLHILFFGLENVMPTSAARYFHHGGWPALNAYLLRVIIYGECVTAAVAIAIAAAPEFWLSWVFGDEYSNYGYVLRWFAAIYVIHYLYIPVRACLRAIERTRAVFLAFLFSAVFSAGAVYPLIKLFDLTGAMVGILIVNLILLTVQFAELRKADR